MNRLFTFGCSYTQYAWPTWANILSLEFNEFYNWGRSGLGNRAIAERVAEAHARYKFTKDDVVIIQWSSHLRNDWWHKYSLPERGEGWKTCGSVFNMINGEIYDKNWIDTFFYEPAYFMHTLNNILLTQSLLKSVGCTWFMTSIGDIRNLGIDLAQSVDYGEQGNIANPSDKGKDKVAWQKLPQFSFYEDTIWTDNQDHWLAPIESIARKDLDTHYGYVDDTPNGTNEFEIDLHPTPRQYLYWVVTELKDRLELSNNLISKAEQIADFVDTHNKNTQFSKIAFASTLLDKQFFSEVIPELNWPTQPQGF